MNRLRTYLAPPANPRARSAVRFAVKKILRLLHLEGIAIKGLIVIQSRLPAASQWQWPSETSKCRARLAPFCAGYGVDLGYGGDPIAEHAIRVDMPQPYTRLGEAPVQLGGAAEHLVWFRDDTLDFVYSSHLLEDFDDTEAVLREWLRVLRPGGRLILYCPDEQRFRLHCAATGQPYNPHHKHADFSLAYVKDILARLGQDRFLHENPDIDVYSWELVCVKQPVS
jgi:predicted SAM-dependent methyltransferase